MSKSSYTAPRLLSLALEAASVGSNSVGLSSSQIYVKCPPDCQPIAIFCSNRSAQLERYRVQRPCDLRVSLRNTESNTPAAVGQESSEGSERIKLGIPMGSPNLHSLESHLTHTPNQEVIHPRPHPLGASRWLAAFQTGRALPVTTGYGRVKGCSSKEGNEHE